MDMTAAEKLEAFGLDNILARLENGQSQREIAAEVCVGQNRLNEWLHADVDRSARTQAALRAGAQVYEDQAVAVLEETYTMLREADKPHPNGSAVAMLARERAQAAWRQASVRDRRYADGRQGDTYIDARKQALTSITIQTVRAGGGVRGQVGVGDEKVGVLGSTATQVKSKRKSKQAITDVTPRQIENQAIELPELKVVKTSQMSMIGRGLNLEDYE